MATVDRASLTGWNFNAAIAQSSPRFVTIQVQNMLLFQVGFQLEHLRHAGALRQGRQVYEWEEDAGL
jgi:hypothetical protein